MISVIIPSYNAEKTIRRCLESVLTQKASFEIVLADDGSTDTTLKIAEEYGDRVRRLPLPHGGVSEARNAGFAAAVGEWVLFLDADDALLPGALAKLESYMSDDEDAVCGTICRGNETCKTSGKVATYSAGHELMDFVLVDPTNYLTIHGWSFRRKEEMPRFNLALRIGEDSEWVLRYLRTAQKVVFISTPVYRYMVSACSTVRKWRAGQDKDYLNMLANLGQGPAGQEKGWPLFVLTNYLLILTHVIFHPSNPHRRRDQFKAARELRDEPVISAAFENAQLRGLNLSKKLVLACLKRNWTWPAYLAVRLRQAQNRMRAS